MTHDEFKKQLIAMSVKCLNDGAQKLHEALIDKPDEETEKLINKMKSAALYLAVHFDQGDL